MWKQARWAVPSLILAASLSAPSALAAEADACKVVRMSDPGWTDITTTNAITGLLLEALDYQQRVDHLSVPITYQGLKMGQSDVFLGNWMPAQKPMVEPKLKEGSIEVLQRNLENAKFTLAVPRYVADAGVKSFADLEKYADKFEHKIYGIEAGAPANQNIRKMLDSKAFGLNGWALMESSESGMLSQVTRKIQNKQWVVFLGWEPHMMNTKFAISYLSGGDAFFGPNYGGATVQTVARKGYAAQCPNVARLFRQLKFNVDLENRIITDVLDQKMNVTAAAMQRLKEHPELLNSWLAGVKTRSGGDGLAAVKKKLALK